MTRLIIISTKLFEAQNSKSGKVLNTFLNALILEIFSLCIQLKRIVTTKTASQLNTNVNDLGSWFKMWSIWDLEVNISLVHFIMYCSCAIKLWIQNVVVEHWSSQSSMVYCSKMGWQLIVSNLSNHNNYRLKAFIHGSVWMVHSSY